MAGKILKRIKCKMKIVISHSHDKKEHESTRSGMKFPNTGAEDTGLSH